MLKYLTGDLGLDEAAKDAWLARWLRDGLEACEGLLAQRDEQSEFCFGDTPGLADICLVPQVFSAERFGISLCRSAAYFRRIRRLSVALSV